MIYYLIGIKQGIFTDFSSLYGYCLGDAALIIASGIAIAIVVVAVGVAVGAGVVAYRYVYVPVKDAWHTLGNYQQAWQYIQKKLF